MANGTWRLDFRDVPVLTYNHVAWLPEWKWTSFKTEVLRQDVDSAKFSFDSQRLGLSGTAEMKLEEGRLVAAYDFEASEDKDIIGAGSEFRINDDDDLFEGQIRTPELLPDGRHGFVVKTGAGDIKVELAGAANPKVHFDRGERTRIRAFWFNQHIEKGRHEFEVILEMPKSTKAMPSLGAHLAPDQMQNWFDDSIDATKSPVDLRNAPAKGPLPRVHTRGSDLVLEDGSPIRFFGTNLSSYALFKDNKKKVSAQAKRMAALGFNLVRLHHHDSHWVAPNIFGRKAETTRKLSESSLERLDWWIKSLTENGIYVWIDLHVGRRFKEADGVDHFDELEEHDGRAKGFNFVNRSIEARMFEFAKQYLDRVNPYTERRIADDPGVVAVLMTNENDLVGHFGTMFLADKDNPAHRELFLSQAESVIEEEDLPRRKALRTWEPGPAKIVLSRLEEAFFRRHDAMLDAIELRPLRVRGNAWGSMSLYALPSLVGGDLVDVHAYGEAGALENNPRFAANFIHKIGSFQVVGKPLSVSEWNVPWPAEDRFVYPLYVAAIASLQGWDATMLYAWTQSPLTMPTRVGEWTTLADPAFVATIPAASIMIRDGHVRAGTSLHAIRLDEQTLYGRRVSSKTSRSLRTLVERSRMAVLLPGNEAPAGATIVEDLDRDFIPGSDSVVESDTGELRRDWKKGLLTIDTPKTQAVIGSLDERSIPLGNVTVSSSTARATIAFTAMDQKPLKSSERILVTTVARARAPNDKHPFHAEPVVAEFSIASVHALRMRALDPSGGTLKVFKPSSVERQQGSSGDEKPAKLQTFTIDGKLSTHWYVLEPRGLLKIDGLVPNAGG